MHVVAAVTAVNPALVARQLPPAHPVPIYRLGPIGKWFRIIPGLTGGRDTVSRTAPTALFYLARGINGDVGRPARRETSPANRPADRGRVFVMTTPPGVGMASCRGNGC